MGAALSAEALVQVRAYLDGWDGLAVRHKDTGTRDYVNVRWATYGAPKARTYTIGKGGTLGAAAVALGVSVASLAGYNHITNPDAVTPGQVVTAPPAKWSPAPTVTVKPSTATVRPSKPVSRPAPKPTTRKPVAPVRKPSRPVVATVSRHALKPGARNVSVLRLERALAARGFLPRRWVDGYYGTATVKAVQNAYRWQAKRQPRGGWFAAPVPGPGLLRVLQFKVVR
jgi:LysM repeat protein